MVSAILGTASMSYCFESTTMLISFNSIFKLNGNFLFRHFQATDTKKFYDVWCMNEEEVKQLAQKLLEQNRIITEQQLGLEATPLEDL